MVTQSERFKRFLAEHNRPEQVLQRARAASQSAVPLMRALYVDYQIEADCDYLRGLLALRRELESQEREGMAPRRRRTGELSRPEAEEQLHVVGTRPLSEKEARQEEEKLRRDPYALRKPPRGEHLSSLIERVEPNEDRRESRLDEVWNDPRNLPLKELRKRQDNLSPGDVLRVRITPPRPQAMRRAVDSDVWVGTVWSHDDMEVDYGRRPDRRPDNWRELLGGAREEPFTRDSHRLSQVGEIGDAMEMLAYKLDALDRVCASWDTIAKDAASYLTLKSTWKKEEEKFHARLQALERERRQTLNHRTGGNSKDRRMWASGTQAQKKRVGEELRAARAEFERRLPLERDKLHAQVEKLIETHGGKLESIQSKLPPDRPEVRARMELAGCLLLPHPFPMGGVFPSHEYCVVSRSESESSRYEFLIRHANMLIRKYEFLEEDLVRRVLIPDKDGCICIMFAEEPSQDQQHFIYVPFFGISGGTRTDFTVDQYMKRLGVPPISGERVLPEEHLGRGGKRLMDRFFRLFDFFGQRKALGLKTPAKQAMLSYMGFIDKDWVGEDELHQHIHNIESWNSIQCAEPSAVMAAAQLHYRMADMELSVPFEGDHRVPFHDHSGTGWGKETCGRCAISEMTFAGVVASGNRKLVNMKSVIMKKEDLLETQRVHPFKQTLGPELVYNRDRAREAYGKPPDRDDGTSGVKKERVVKRDAQYPAMQRFHDLGIAQSSQQPFFLNARKQPRPLPVEDPGSIPKLIERFDLGGIFHAARDTGSHRALVNPTAAFALLQAEAREQRKVIESELGTSSKEPLSKTSTPDLDRPLKLALALSLLLPIDQASSLGECYRTLRSLPEGTGDSDTSDMTRYYYVLNAMLSATAHLRPTSGSSPSPSLGSTTFAPPAPSWRQVGGFQLTADHQDMLTHDLTDYFDDRLIDAFLALVEEERATVHRRYDVPVGALVGNDVWTPPHGLQQVRSGGLASVEVQVLNVGGNHWVVGVRYPQSQPGVVYLYDPLQPLVVSEGLQTRLRRCFGGGGLTIERVRGPRQPGGYECGAYVCGAIELLTRTADPVAALQSLQRAAFNNTTLRGNIHHSLVAEALGGF
ncbi:C48 family peptidase [Myxococcus sp. K15C18031901]|uniref:C48 family peptidase n=1 Tax=Myxococcus dinghuensis TaxID=2906761 RepID=UPI0020A79545|nr:C48 family peptidase [Myxococcus dinghuensis]MCP3100462.1 C48 family peptidase [Myxococcus dinghuensis]